MPAEMGGKVKLRKVGLELFMKLHLRDTGATFLRIGSHSVTYNLTRLNASRLNPSQRPVLDLPTPEGWKTESTYMTGYTYRDGLPAHSLTYT